jgi:glucan 1,3-beta-glucosidase
MTLEVFDGTDAVDQWTFDQTEDANYKLEDHQESFFTEHDVYKLANCDINA